MENEKSYIRMYPVTGAEEIELLFEKKSGLFFVRRENISIAYSDPKEAWIRYSTLITNLVLKRISENYKGVANQNESE